MILTLENENDIDIEKVINNCQDYMFNNKNIYKHLKNKEKINTIIHDKAQINVFELNKNNNLYFKGIDFHNKQTQQQTQEQYILETKRETEKQSETENNNVNNSVNNIKLQFEKIYTLKNIDTLFWLFYVIVNMECNVGIDVNYTDITYKQERDEKYKVVEYIQKNMKTLKKVKQINIKETLERFVALEKIKTSDIITLSYIYKINIALIYNSLCFLNMFGSEDNNQDILNKKIYIYKENTFILPDENIDENNNNEKYLHDKYYIFSDYNKPIRCESSYKLQELQDISTRLSLPTTQNNKKMKKKDLYNQLKEYIHFTLSHET
jgi:hypothetical protein